MCVSERKSERRICTLLSLKFPMVSSGLIKYKPAFRGFKMSETWAGSTAALVYNAH